MARGFRVLTWTFPTSILCAIQHMTHSTGDSIFPNLRLELRRGCLTLAVLGLLRSEHYGYELRKALDEQGLEVDEGTLYPLVRRLETQGLLESEWREESKRRKRFYRLTDDGEIILHKLLEELRRLNASLTSILQEA
jgi:PadR family transcriptional regulator, regulatory protein PadR